MRVTDSMTKSGHDTTSWTQIIEGLVHPEAQLHWREPNPYWRNGPISEMREPIVRTAAAIDWAAIGPGPALLALDNGPELFLALMACLISGRAFCIVNSDRAEGFIATMAKAGDASLKPDIIIATGELPRSPCPVISPSACLQEPVGHDDRPSVGNEGPTRSDLDRIVYFQPTSGSSGFPKLVPIRGAMLMSHFEAIVDRMGAGRNDVMSCWAPMSHDMGLMAALLMLHVGGTYVGSSPRIFRRSPLSWLHDIHRSRATLTTGPSLSLSLVPRLLKADADLDLSCLRYAWIGAEPLYWSVVQEFQDRLRSTGLSPAAIRPTYGMAEAVVGISFPHPGSPLRLARHPGSGSSTPGTLLLSNGPALQGIDVAVWSAEGQEVGEGTVGRLMVRGASVAPGYWGMASDLIDGWRDTGDLGFLQAGEVYVVGRTKDVIIRGGVNHAAEDLEVTVRGALEDELVRVAAISVIEHAAAKEWFHVVVEARRPMEDRRIAIARRLVERHGITPDFIHFIERGSMPLTSSGKVRRQILRDTYGSKIAESVVGEA